MFQDGLYNLLANTESLTTLLGTSRGDNTSGIFPVQAIREPTLPYLIFSRVSGQPQTNTYQGANALQVSRFRFSCYGSSQRQAVQLANALKSFFASYTGTLNDGSVVQQVMQELEVDDSESVPNGTIWATHLDYVFYYVDGTVS